MTSEDGATIPHVQLQWHKVKIVYKKDAGNGIAGAEVYIDGTLVNAGVNSPTLSGWYATWIQMKIGGAYGGEMYVDNIRVTEGDHDPIPLPEADLVNLDFEDVEEGQLPDGGTLGVGEGYSGPNADKYSYSAGVKTINGNKVLALKGTMRIPESNEDTGVFWRYPLGGKYDNVTLSYHVARACDISGYLYFPTVSHGWMPVRFGVCGNDYLMWENSTSTSRLAVTPVGEDIPISNERLQWHKVKVVYSRSVEGSKAQVKVYIDDVLTNIDVYNDDNVQISHVLMNIHKNGGGEMYVDNIRVTEGDHDPVPLPEDVPVTGLEASVTSISLNVGGHQFVNPVVKPENATDKQLTFTSSDSSVASVDEWGEVIGMKAGTATITVVPAAATTDTIQLEIPVTVTERAPATQTIYVSVEGGGDGTSDTSRCTLDEALNQVSSLHASLNGDVVVSLAPGYYLRTETLRLNETHGGTNNYYVTYKAEGEVTIGGKKVITGWSDTNGDGIYETDATGVQTRQLYVGNVRATRARSEGGLLNPAQYTNAAGTDIGYICDNVEFSNWAHPEDLEFVFHAGWTNPRNGVGTLECKEDKMYITMTQPGWSWLQTKGGTCTVENPAYYENALELQDEPGEWYLDTHDGIIYYMPRAWENMGEVEISAPVVEDLIWIEGSDYDNMVQNIEFQGITFADTTWNRPTEQEVHSDTQSNYLRERLVTNGADGGQIYDHLADAAVTVKRANTVNFTGCTFTRLGIIGLKLVDGVQNSMITGNKFYDISGSAVAIGEPDWRNEDYINPSDPNKLMKNCDVLNNYIHNIGVDYQSSSAVSLGFGANMDFSYNEIFDIPYSGFHVGYGFDFGFTNILKNLKIEHNFIYDVMEGEIIDGGPIYTNGPSAGSEDNYNMVTDNYIRNSIYSMSSLYPDVGSTYYNFERNVIDESENEDLRQAKLGRPARWFIIYYPERKTHHISASDNYSTTDSKLIKAGGVAISVEDAIVCDPENWPEAAQEIIDNAGLQSAYSDLQNGYAERFFANIQDVLELKSIGETYQINVGGFDGKDHGVSSITNLDMKVYYSVDDTEVASVSETGLVTSKKSGQTTLRVTVVSGNILREMEYDLYVADQLAEVVLSNAKNDQILLYESSSAFVPVVYGKTTLGQEVELESVQYSVENTGVARVADGNQIEPVAAGETVLTITGVYNGTEVTAEYVLKVEVDPQFVPHNMWEIFDPQYRDTWTSGATITYGEGSISTTTSTNITFTQREYSNELMTFKLKIDTSTGTGGWPTVVLRLQEAGKLVTKSKGYTFIFNGDTGFELHRFNNGVRTQFYGNETDVPQICGPSITGCFEYGKEHTIEMGTLNEGNGVRLVLNIDGEEVVNILDDGEGAITESGYFGLVGRGETFTLTKNITDASSVQGYVAGINTADTEVRQNDTVAVNVKVEHDTESAFAAGEIKISYDHSLLTFNKDLSSLGTARVEAENGVLTLEEYGADKTTGNGVYVLAFDAASTGTATVTMTSARFSNAVGAEAADLTVANITKPTVTVAISKQAYTVTLPTDGILDGLSEAVDGENYTFSVTDYRNYNYTISATMGGGEAIVRDNQDGTYTIENVTGALEITATRTPKTYNVNMNDVALEVITSPVTTATYGTDYSFGIPQAITGGYYYSLESITIGGNAYTGYESAVSEGNNVYTIAGTDITGDISITVSKSAAAANVTVTGTGAGAAAGYTATATLGSPYTLTITPETGYVYTVTATMGGTAATVIDNQDNTYTIANVTGPIVFTVERAADTSEITVSQYLKLDGTVMWLVKDTKEVEDGKVPTYDGNAMFWSEKYNDGNGCYCYLVIADTLSVETAKAAAGIQTADKLTVDYGMDVNKTGKVDANDAQLTYNMYNTMYGAFTADVTLEKFLRADVNGDAVVSVNDAVAIIDAILAE